MALLFEGFSQASTRRYVRYKDQHGRRWGVNLENKSGAPTGNWTAPPAPIVPDAHFFKLSKDPDSPNELTIDYDAIIQELREALVAYNKEGQRLMSQRHGDKYRPDMPLDSDIGLVLGDRPQPVEPWIAAKQGNRYILGLTDTVDLRLAPFLNLKGADDEEMDFSDIPEEDFSEIEEAADPEALGGKRVAIKTKSEWHPFLKERMAAGKSMKEAAAEWKQRKEHPTE